MTFQPVFAEETCCSDEYRCFQSVIWACIEGLLCRMETGLELIHKEPTLDEQERIWKNWQLMSDEEKEISDKKCLEISGMTNEELNDWIMKNHWNKLNKFDLTYKNIIKNMENK